MALFDKTIGGIIIGFAAGTLLRSKPAGGESTIRPLAKGLLKGGLMVADQVRLLAAEAAEQVKDIVAEVRAESSDAGSQDATAPDAKRAHKG